jgi:predicted ATPase
VLFRATKAARFRAVLYVAANAGRFSLVMEQHGLLRPLSVAELSDGTLRYLLWVAALLTPRPPALMVLNEPETSLHADLLGRLGRLIAQSSRRTQILVVTHAGALIKALREQPECNSLVLEMSFGETGLERVNALELPAGNWPDR